MRTAYGPPNGQIVFFEELRATLNGVFATRFGPDSAQ